MSRIGAKINEARMKAGFSAKMLAKKVGVAEGFITDVETGRKIANEDFIKRVEKVLGSSLSDDIFEEVTEPIENIKEPVVNKTINKQWEDAFSHILKKIPVCDVNFREIFEYKYLPVIDRKIEGYGADKLVYIKAPDDSMRGFRINKDDRIMVYQNPEVQNNSVSVIDIEGKRYIRQLKRLDSNKVLIISHGSELKTETRDVKSFNVIGKCIKLEIEL